MSSSSQNSSPPNKDEVNKKDESNNTQPSVDLIRLTNELYRLLKQELRIEQQRLER